MMCLLYLINNFYNFEIDRYLHIFKQSLVSLAVQYIQWRRKMPKSVGGGGAHRHVIYVPSVKNQYK